MRTGRSAALIHWLIAILIGTSCLSGAMPAAAASPPIRDRELLFGIAGHAWWLDDHLDTFVAAYRDLGITSVRLSIDWKVIEPTPGVYQWDRYDRVLGRLVDERFTIVGVFVTVPPWAASDPAACGIPTQEPAACDLRPEHRPAFDRAARATLTRYPFIRHWEFWNEPEQWVHLGQNAADYLLLLTRFYAIAKEVDPAIQVAAATLAGWDYIGWLYAEVDQTLGPGHRPWDAVAFHPYNTHRVRDADGEELTLRYAAVMQLRREMVTHGDRHKPLWITEYGWDVAPEAQATALREALTWLLSRDYIEMAHLHMLHDWEREQFGLMRTVPDVVGVGPIDRTTRFEPKEPYYSAFRDFHRPAPPRAPDLGAAATGQLVAPVFLAAWSPRAGDLGLPLTRPFWEQRTAGDSALVQYFERGRLEWRRPGTVTLGLLGDEALQARGWLDGVGQPLHAVTQAGPSVAPEDGRYFPETGQMLRGPFLARWEAAGGVAALGFPRTNTIDEMLPDGSVQRTQYTQRGQLMQIVTGDTASPVYLARIGVETLQQRGWLDTDERPAPVHLNPARRAVR
ncbi:MAG: hypothetical protein IT340_16395 [Chloroflexi bacterium]|nr:hypothetical protein [Chloroflexota bacterium]